MSHITLTNSNFETEVISSDIPVLIDFWAPWCGPCRMLTPTIEELGKELAGKVKVGKINVDEQRDLAARFSIMSIPTLAVVKNGKIVSTAVGVRPKDAILKMLEE